jgi:hypothetical protein
MMVVIHGHIVHHGGEVVSGHAVAAAQDKIIQLFVGKDDSGP